jgi:hypothetical protein
MFLDIKMELLEKFVDETFDQSYTFTTEQLKQSKDRIKIKINECLIDSLKYEKDKLDDGAINAL